MPLALRHLLEKKKRKFRDNQPINDDIYLPFSLLIILKPQVIGSFDHAVGRGGGGTKEPRIWREPKSLAPLLHLFYLLIPSNPLVRETEQNWRIEWLPAEKISSFNGTET
jgi:hypothetical protein